MPIKYKEIPIKLFNFSGRLSQIYSKGFEYSMVNKAFEQISTYFMCKDYLNDIVWGTIHKKEKFACYGFEWNYNSQQIDLRHTRLLVRNTSMDNDEVIESVEHSVDLINDMYEMMDPSRLKMRILGTFKDGKYMNVLLSLPPKMAFAPPLLSVTTLLLRAGTVYQSNKNKPDEPLAYLHALRLGMLEHKNFTNNDVTYLRNGWKALEQFLIKGYKFFFGGKIKDNWPKQDTDIQSVHNNFGIQSYAQNLFNEKESFRKSLKEKGHVI